MPKRYFHSCWRYQVKSLEPVRATRHKGSFLLTDRKGMGFGGMPRKHAQLLDSRPRKLLGYSLTWTTAIPDFSMRFILSRKDRVEISAAACWLCSVKQATTYIE